MNVVDKIRTELAEYFWSRTIEFWKSGLVSLPDRWMTIVENEGEYTLD